MATDIHGKVHPAFDPVRDVFHGLFSDGSEFKELGASLAVFKDGEEVVNLWGGLADAEANRPWQQNTLTHVFSSSKILPALAVAQLVSQGKLNYDDPIAKHWPEFGQQGKGAITVSQVLSHQSGVNTFEAPITPDDFLDWDATCSRLAEQAPTFEPGKVTSYHAVTLGHLLMEVVRRVSGLMPADYVAQYIAKPLDAEVFIGLAERDWPRVSTLVPPPMPKGAPPFDPKAAKALANPMIIPGVTTATANWRKSQIPAVNAHVSAIGLAKIWGAMGNGGALNGTPLLSKETIETMSKPLSGDDLLLGPGRWAAGVSRNRGNLGPLETTIGNFGFGGSFGLADLSLGVGAAYTPNRLYPSILKDPRAQALASKIIECAQKA